MIYIECRECNAVYAMPKGATIGEMGTWMRWHAHDGPAHELAVLSALESQATKMRATLEVTREGLEIAMARAQDYAEGQRDAAAYITLQLGIAAMEGDPVSPRGRGRNAMLQAVALDLARRVLAVGNVALAARVSADAESVREQPDALDLRSPPRGRRPRGGV